MNYKSNLVDKVDKVLKISQETEVSKSSIDSLKNLKSEASNFSVKVPLMGGFNAGKSSLLNSFLDQELLPTNIRPETAIATELKYNEKESIIAHKEDKSTEEHNINNIDELKNDYMFLEVFKNNKKLKDLNDIVLVDMPGLDSSLELHNKAIMNYIDEGVFYIVIADISHGLKDTVINFLKELDVYNLNFAVLLNKSDLKPEDQIEEVVNNTSSIIRSIVGKDIFVGAISAKENEINDFHNVIESINKNKLFQDEFEDRLLESTNNLISELEMKLNLETVDTDEIDNKINEIEKKINQINNKISDEKNRINKQFSNETVDKVLNDVRVALNSNIDRLVQAAKMGQDQFSKAVNQIIRPVLVNSSQENIEVVLLDSFNNISKELEEMSHILQKIILPDSKDPTSKMPPIHLSALNKKNTTFKAIIGATGITSTIIAPWLHIIIFFLPEIFQLLGKIGNLIGLGDNKIKNQINDVVIPDILSRIRPKIEEGLETTNQKFIEEVNNEVLKEKDKLMNALNNAKKEKEMAKKDFEKKKEDIKNNIQELKAIKASI